jgi:DNA adenine methylase
MKPPFSYYGGKTRVADQIVALLPDHEHYVEPFAGSLAVLLAKPAARMETVNDIDDRLMTFWRVLRERPDELIRACALTPHSRAEQRLSQDLDGCDELEVARRVWVRISQSRTGTLRNTGWRHFVNAGGESASMPGYLAGYVDRMAAIAERLHAVSLESRPAREVIETYGAHPTTLLYLDPPYLAEVRNGRNYSHEMANTDEHRELAAAAADCAAAVVVSGYDSPLYDALYDGWERHEISAMTTQGGTHGRRTEVLWSNRPLHREQGLFEVMAS